MNIENFEELFGNTPFENIQKIQQYIKNNYIPIQKIKENIKELEKRKQEYEEENTIDEDYFFDINGYNSAISVLQELLEREEEV